MKYCAKLLVLTCLLGFLSPVYATPSDSDCEETKPCITDVIVSKVTYYTKVNGSFQKLGVIKKKDLKKRLKEKPKTNGIDTSTGISMLEIAFDDINEGNPVYIASNAFKLSNAPKINCDELGELTATIQGSDQNQTTGVSTGHSSNSNKYCKVKKS